AHAPVPPGERAPGRSREGAGGARLRAIEGELAAMRWPCPPPHLNEPWSATPPGLIWIAALPPRGVLHVQMLAPMAPAAEIPDKAYHAFRYRAEVSCDWASARSWAQADAGAVVGGVHAESPPSRLS